ncbi:Hypothetical predicted protein [Octopus vulgaris]|nr:Hypothetical predicted protein [Octopus vulgaris]
MTFEIVEKLKVKAESISANHISVIVLLFLIVYLFRADDIYNLQPMWRKRADTHLYANGKYPLENEALPSPIVTDLDSDGTNEIILLSNDMKLSILVLPDVDNRDEEDKILPHVIVKCKTMLSPKSEQLGWPVAMTTGYLLPYKSMVQVRKQVIVVVTDHWQVLCFDENLQLLWTQQLRNMSGTAHSQFYMKSMSVLVLPFSVKKSDTGMIIVGGSYGHKVHKDEHTDKNETLSEPKSSEQQDTLTHFSTFALNGLDGAIRWHHLPGDFSGKRSEAKTGHHWKLALRKNGLHIGELGWDHYRTDLIQHLPHSWNNLRDTRFVAARMEKQLDDQSKDNTESQPHPIRSALESEHLAGYAHGGQRPHNPSDHIPEPNAVIIYNQFGIEVLNLVSGRPITRLSLPVEGATYVNFDGDFSIEAVSSGGAGGRNPCYIDVHRFYPEKESINQIAVCVTKRLFWSRSWSYEEDANRFLAPIVVKSVAKKSGILQHLMGHRLPTNKVAYDIVTVSSSGRVTSHSSDGAYQWQTQTSSSWFEEGRAALKDKVSNIERWEIYTKSFLPNYQSLSLQVYGTKDALVFAGWKRLTLLDLKEGTILASHSTPCHPTAPLVIGDFNNDGWKDIILTCKMGYIGFSIEKKASHLYTLMYATTVFLSIIVVTWLLHAEDQVPEDID